MSKHLALFAALGVATAPVAAQANVQRSTAPVEDASEIGGSGTVLLILAVAAIIGGILAAASGGDDPVSA